MKAIIIIACFVTFCGVNSDIELVAECASCNAISLPLIKLGEKCYYVELTAQVNWYNAMHFCHFHGMRLATILDESENTLLGEHIKKLGIPPDTQRIWTSGSDLGQEGTWYWTSLGIRFPYSEWRLGQPDNYWGKEHCLDVAILHGKLQWNDLPCHYELPFICETSELYTDHTIIDIRYRKSSNKI